MKQLLSALIFVCSFLSLQSMQVQQRNNTADAYWLVDRMDIPDGSEKLRSYPQLSESDILKIPHFQEIKNSCGSLSFNRQLYVQDTNLIALHHLAKAIKNESVTKKNLPRSTHSLISLINLANVLNHEQIKKVGIKKIIKNNDYAYQTITLHTDVEKILATELAKKTNFISRIIKNYTDNESKEYFYLDHEKKGIRGLFKGIEEKTILFFDPKSCTTLSGTYHNHHIKNIIFYTHKNFLGDLTYALPTANNICWLAWMFAKTPPYALFNAEKEQILSISFIQANKEQNRFIIEALTENEGIKHYFLDTVTQTGASIPQIKQCCFSPNVDELYIVNADNQICMFNQKTREANPIPELDQKSTELPLITSHENGTLAAIFVNDDIAHLKIKDNTLVSNLELPLLSKDEATFTRLANKKIFPTTYKTITINNAGDKVFLVAQKCNLSKKTFDIILQIYDCKEKILVSKNILTDHEITTKIELYTTKLTHNDQLLIININPYSCIFYDTATGIMWEKNPVVRLLEDGHTLMLETLYNNQSRATTLNAQNLVTQPIQQCLTNVALGNIPSELIELIESTKKQQCTSLVHKTAVSDNLLAKITTMPVYIQKLCSHSFILTGQKWYQKAFSYIKRAKETVSPVVRFTLATATAFLVLLLLDIYTPTIKILPLAGGIMQILSIPSPLI